MNDDENETSEPTRFAWIRDGLLIAGTLADWARMWEGDYYSGDLDLTRTLITVPGLPDTASVTIDGRA